MPRTDHEFTRLAQPTLAAPSPMPAGRKAARWVRIVLAVILLVAAAPSPSDARFDRGNVGLPGDNPSLEPGDPLPPPPVLPPLQIRSYGLNFIEIYVKPPAGLTSQLLKEDANGSFVPFRTLTPGVEATIRDDNLGLGREYCYRMIILGGGARPDETYTRCMTTEWRVGFEGLGISPDESAEVLRLFDWRDTQRLAQGSEEEPALYHMNVLIEGADPLAEQGLRVMGMHVQPQPIFSEELAGWDDSQSTARACTPGIEDLAPVAMTAATRGKKNLPGVRTGSCVPVGRWVFAVVPGSIYNEVRTRMLEQIARGEAPGLRAMVFRRVPVAEALAPGVSRHVLNYVFLGQQGFTFNAIQRCSNLPDGTRVCQTQQEILGWILRKIVYWAVEIGDAVVQAVRSVIGRVARLIKGELRLDLNFNLLNTDAGFGTNERMRSGWSGQPLYLAGLKVEVRQGLAAFYAETDSQGFVTLTVAKNSDTKVCIQVENDTVEITEYLIEKTICVANLGKLSDYTKQTIDVRHPYFNTLAAMTDARRYLYARAGIDMPKVTVLVGGQADQLAAAGRSFAPCMGRVPGLIGLGADIVGALGSLLNPAFLVATTALEFFYSVDIVLRSDDDDSRGVPVHEYGHVVMCEMLLNQGIDAFEMAWTDVILATSDQSAGSEASYLNEAWADFLTEQVLGGTNYFAPNSALVSMGINYCPAASTCYDQNFSDQSTFKGQVARVVATLHDAFDGNPQGVGANDGSHWAQSGTGTPFTYVGQNDSDSGDEAVRLPGTALATLFEHWDDRGQLLNEDNFLGGLADLMKAQGVAESDVCALFALHDPGASCPGYVARRAWLPWIDDTGSAGMLDALAAAPAPAPVPGAAPAGDAALIVAIADLDPPVEKPRRGDDEKCTKCAPLVVFDGTQKVRVEGLGKEQRESAFAFRLGEGSFKGIDPLGQLIDGTWSALDKGGAKLRLRPGAEAKDALVNLLAESVQSLGVDPDSVRMSGRPKITLKLEKGGTITARIALRFKVDVDGQTLRGTYVASLVGA